MESELKVIADRREKLGPGPPCGRWSVRAGHCVCRPKMGVIEERQSAAKMWKGGLADLDLNRLSCGGQI